MIVGIDISTSCTGICVLNDNGTLHSIHHIELKKISSFYQKVEAVIGLIIHELKLPPEARFFVEAPLLHFKMKASMASTIALLQRFNACVCYSIFRAYGAEPKMVSVISARKTIGLSVPKKIKKKEAKHLIFEQIRARNVIPEDAWSWKKTGRPKDWCYDRADAYVIARAAYEEESRQKKEA